MMASSCTAASTSVQDRVNTVITNRLFAAASLVCVVSGAALAQSGDPLVGTWNLNVAKSNSAAFTSGTSKIETVGAGVQASPSSW